MGDTEVFKPAGEYKIEPAKEISTAVIRELITERWYRIAGKLTKEQQIRFKWPKATVDGILVQCPQCGKIHEVRTILTKECSQCHRSFEIICQNQRSRVVWVPPSKRRLYDEIYCLTFHKRLVP